jgi:hypothetical protein
MSSKADVNLDKPLAAVSGEPGSKSAKDCNDIPES